LRAKLHACRRRHGFYQRKKKDLAMKNSMSAKFRAAFAGAVLGATALAVAAPASARELDKADPAASLQNAFTQVVCRDVIRNGRLIGRNCERVYTPGPQVAPPVNPGVQVFGLILREIERNQRHHHHRPHYHPPFHRHHH
jgi:hypothetical protein